MASEASRRYEAAVAGGATAPQQAPQFEASDLESLQGRWDIVACLDVLIHYDQVHSAPSESPTRLRACQPHAHSICMSLQADGPGVCSCAC